MVAGSLMRFLPLWLRDRRNMGANADFTIPQADAE
jgi:hypothetical protein